MTMPIAAARRESGDERKLAIALAARALIIEKGLEGLRTRDIAQRVGINIATLHYHVPSKEALIALVAASIRTDFQSQSLRRPRAGKSALQLLRMEFEDFREIVTDMPDLIIILTELVERARRDPVVAAIMGPIYNFWRRQFVEIFRRGVLEGAFRADLDPVAAALIVTGALSDYWRDRTEFQSSLDSFFAELERAFVLPSPPQG
ncbi:TetR/AcrR family transcriptional regulator [uncultured Devosia sp.]|uniref:TetR/AcrR family transcriptional regulator n=1 Tax=uncultured Devosia sp. TaxID=211434 RepID=UPI0035CC1826